MESLAAYKDDAIASDTVAVYQQQKFSGNDPSNTSEAVICHMGSPEMLQHQNARSKTMFHGRVAHGSTSQTSAVQKSVRSNKRSGRRRGSRVVGGAFAPR